MVKNKNLISDAYPFGRVCISLEVLPMKIAEECKVGKGRDEPNVNPHLPPPIGRMQWSWNPYTLFVIKLFFLILIYLLFLVSIYPT